MKARTLLAPLAIALVLIAFAISALAAPTATTASTVSAAAPAASSGRHARRNSTRCPRLRTIVTPPPEPSPVRPPRRLTPDPALHLRRPRHRPPRPSIGALTRAASVDVDASRIGRPGSPQILALRRTSTLASSTTVTSGEIPAQRPGIASFPGLPALSTISGRTARTVIVDIGGGKITWQLSDIIEEA
jgi:hypothetical protein